MGITKDSMSTVNGQSVNTMETLGNLAKKMGSETAFSATECSQALNYLALAGYNTEQMCNTLPTVLNLALAGGIDLASASDMVTDAMSALGMGVDEAGTMVDQMAKTASTTNTSVAQLERVFLPLVRQLSPSKAEICRIEYCSWYSCQQWYQRCRGWYSSSKYYSFLCRTLRIKRLMQWSPFGVQVYDSQGNMRSMNDILGDLNTSMDGMTSAEKDNLISKIFNKTDLANEMLCLQIQVSPGMICRVP